MLAQTMKITPAQNTQAILAGNALTPLMVHLMGAPCAVLPGGENIQFQVDNTLLLMAYLGANSGKTFRRTDLATLFYPDHEEQNANQNIRQVIHRLRKLLKDDTREIPGLSVDAMTIRINPDGPLVTDIQQFNEQSQASQKFMQQHSHRRFEICRTCMGKFEKLASIYAGDFLDGYLPHTNGLLDEWVPQVRQEYKSKLIWVLHWLATYHFERAQYDQCEAYLNRILKLEPLDETALRYYMKILTNIGHRNQALVRYHDFHRKLQANLHLMPEEETILLAQKIRTGGDTIADHLNPFRGNLPFSQQEINGDYLPDSTIPFFGREQEIGQILDLLESREHRVICVKGVIGSGKTRVALQAALLDNNTWADHIYLVLINKESSFSNDLISTMVHALGVPSNNSFEHRKNLVNFLRDKESLIIIDNLDEFPDQADVIQYLVGLCPKIKFIITTRKHLGIRGEKVVYFNGLNFPSLQAEAIDFNAIDLEAFVNRYSALQLFNEVAMRARSDFEIKPVNISFVIQICEMLIGLPLGIELAASYARLFTCEEIRDGVYGCLNGIEGVHAFISDRHGNFKKRFEYVWESLSETEKELVKIVQKYPEGVVTDDLLADKLTTIETLVTLQDKSTLIRLPGSMVKLHPLVRFYVSQ